jgi:hypothetical protein
MMSARFRFVVVVGIVLVTAFVTAGRKGRALSLCAIAEEPEKYSDLFLRVKGTFYGYSTGTMHINGSECDPGGNAWATIALGDSLELTTENQALLESVAGLGSRREYVKAEVIVDGRISDLKQRCFAPEFTIHVTRLEPLTPVFVMQLPVDQE